MDDEVEKAVHALGLVLAEQRAAGQVLSEAQAAQTAAEQASVTAQNHVWDAQRALFAALGGGGR